MTQEFYTAEIEGIPILEDDKLNNFKALVGGLFNRIDGWHFVGAYQEGGFTYVKVVKSGSAIAIVVVATIILSILMVLGYGLGIWNIKILRDKDNAIIESVDSSQKSHEELVNVLVEKGVITRDEGEGILNIVVPPPPPHTTPTIPSLPSGGLFDDLKGIGLGVVFLVAIYALSKN
tara:strand:- start:515 stop:1042 length:528 start_codon:yes stop_codon:yes gene_type:complete